MNKIDYNLLEINEDLIYFFQNTPFMGVAYELWENDKLRSEVEFVNGIENGWHKEWYRNGNLKMEMFLKNAVLHGEKKEWYENGQLKSELTGEFGIVLSSKKWNKEGKLVEEYNLAEDHPQYQSLKISRKNSASSQTNTF